MIALRHNTDYFDLDAGSSISLEADSPLFVTDAIPGLRVYQFRLPTSRNNRQLLQNAAYISRRQAFGVLPDVHIEIFRQHFRTGKLQIESATESQYTVSFVADTGDVATTLKETKLRGLELGSEVVSTASITDIYPNRKYCLATIKNPLFYGNTNPDFGGYVNQFASGAFLTNSSTNEHCLTPFVFVRTVLDGIAALLDYRLQGSFLDEINHLFFYSNCAVDLLDTNGLNVYANTFALADQLPDISCGAFLQALRSLFGVAVSIDSTRKTITFTRLRDIIAQRNYLLLDHAAGRNYSLQPYELDGYRISMQTDGSDELYKRLSLRPWYREEAGQELKISTAAGSLYDVTEVDPRAVTATWTIAQTEQPGTSAAFEIENETGLRLLWYKGIAQNTDGTDFHKASYQDANYDLAMDQSANNLFDTAWTDWLAYVREPGIEMNMQFNITDLLNLDFERKIMAKNTAFLLEKYSLPVSKDGLGAAKVKLRKVKY